MKKLALALLCLWLPYALASDAGGLVEGNAMRVDTLSVQAELAPLVREKTSVELQAIQTRTFEKPYREMFRAVIAVLQDARFKITFTDYNAGIIHAQASPRQIVLTAEEQTRFLDTLRATGRALSSYGTNSAGNAVTPVSTPAPWYSSVPLLGVVISAVAGTIDSIANAGEGLATETRTVSVSVDEQGRSGSKIRVAINSELNFRAGANVHALADDLTDRPEIYQDLFARIDKAAYIIANTQ